MSFDCNFLLIELTTNNISYQIVMPNKNSKFSISYVTKQLASLLVLGSSLIFANWNNASDLICGAWYLIAITLSIQLSQCVCKNDLRVKPGTLSCKILQHFVEEEK